MQSQNELEIVSGDGDSVETPIKFAPCDIETRVSAEYKYMCQRFGGEGVSWCRVMHLTRLDFISDWQIQLSDGSTRSVFFDASVSLDPGT